MTGTTGCPGREAKYVPWSFGVVYECTTCGRRARLGFDKQPLNGERPTYQSIYSFPPHPYGRTQ